MRASSSARRITPASVAQRPSSLTATQPASRRLTRPRDFPFATIISVIARWSLTGFVLGIAHTLVNPPPRLRGCPTQSMITVSRSWSFTAVVAIGSTATTRSPSMMPFAISSRPVEGSIPRPPRSTILVTGRRSGRGDGPEVQSRDASMADRAGVRDGSQCVARRSAQSHPRSAPNCRSQR